MKLRRPPEGFTLIELLVVISIIAVLASLAVPAVTGALVKGQLIQAVSNARQIHMATFSMANDGATNSDATLGWPGEADTGITSVPLFVGHLVGNDYLKAGDLKVFATAGVSAYAKSGATSGSGTALTVSDFELKNSAYKVYMVKESDSSNTVFLATKNYTYNTALSGTATPFSDKGFVIIRKGGDASSLKKQQATNMNLVGTIPGSPDLTSLGTESPGTTVLPYQ